MTSFYRGLAVIAVLYALLMLAVYTATPAYPWQAPPNAPVSADRLGAALDRLSAWIEGNSHYRRVSRPPVLFLSRDELRYVSAFPRSRSMANETRAMYVSGIVFLDKDFDPDRDSYILLHELIHHAQHEAGRRFACAAEREAEAYLLQRRFVEDTGRGEHPDRAFMTTLRCDLPRPRD